MGWKKGEILLFFLKEVCFCPLNNREFSHKGQRKTEKLKERWGAREEREIVLVF